MSDFVPNVVNSFQGSFGPPTVGHFHAMLLSAKEQLTDYPDKNILMLFMPAHKSSSKPHLEPTYNVRIALLEEYCKILQRMFLKERRIKFEVSRIESETGNSATIFTIEKLKSHYSQAVINLTMGIDNMFELPYWTRISEYKVKLGKIYVTERELTADELSSVEIINIKVKEVHLPIPIKTGRPTWYKDDIKSKDEIAGLELPEIEMLEKPIPTSSTLLRCALKQHTISPTDLDTDLDIKNMIIKLSFPKQWNFTENPPMYNKIPLEDIDSLFEDPILKNILVFYELIKDMIPAFKCGNYHNDSRKLIMYGGKYKKINRKKPRKTKRIYKRKKNSKKK